MMENPYITHEKNIADDHLGKHLYANVFHLPRVAFHVVMFQV